MNISEASKKWGCSVVLIYRWLNAGRVPGSFKREEALWTIPDEAKKPEPLKRGRPNKAGKDHGLSFGPKI